MSGIPITWYLLPASTEDLPPLSAQYMYTSKAPPVEADEYERLRAALAAATQRAEAAEAVAGNMLNHLLPDTIRAIVLDLSAAEHDAPDSGEFALLPQTLEFRDKCAAFLGAEWPSSAWDQEWCTALEAERSRRAHALAQSEVHP